MAITIFIAGDIVPYGRTIELFAHRRTKDLFDNIIPDIQKADCHIANLEAPIIYGLPSPINKSGPNLMTTKDTAYVIKEAGFDIVTLANNHFFDQGQQGVKDTLDACNEVGLEVVGGGDNIENARKILYKKIEGKIVAIINACEHESSIATTKHGGSNPLDLIDTSNDIKKARQKADYVILILHGGIEHYQLPTPRMKKWYRYFVTQGADAVINHHQHCISGYEIYEGKPIFYGMGNFNFDRISKYVQQEKWPQGYAIELKLSDSIDFRLIPYIQNGETPGITHRNYHDFEEEIQALNSIIKDDEKLKQELCTYVCKNKRELILPFIPIRNRLFKAFYRRGFLGDIVSKNTALTLQNKIECESHQDMYKTLFEEMK